MELVLNLVWLVVAAASLLLGGIHALRHPRRHGTFVVAAALDCIVCFLFPVISIGDDRRTNPPLSEHSKSTKRVSTDPLAQARLLSAPALPDPPGRAMQYARHSQTEVSLSRERVWFNLDRRPPPQR